VNLARFDRLRPGWMASEGDVWWVAEHLVDVPHTPLLTPAQVRALRRADWRVIRAGLVGLETRQRPWRPRW